MAKRLQTSKKFNAVRIQTMTPMRNDSRIYQFLRTLIVNWEYVYIKIEREGEKQEMNLEDVSEAELKKWLLEKLGDQ